MRHSPLHPMVLVFTLAALVAWVAGCSEDDSSPTTPGETTFHADSEADCAGCHTSEAMLKATVEEDGDTPPPSSGEG